MFWIMEQSTILKHLASILVEDGASGLSPLLGNTFRNRLPEWRGCLSPPFDSVGYWLWCSNSGFGWRRNNQLGWHSWIKRLLFISAKVKPHPWRCVNLHSWRINGKWLIFLLYLLLLHPWSTLRCLLNWEYVSRPESIGKFCDCLALCVVSWILVSFDCICQIMDCLDHKIVSRHCWLRDVFMLEKDSVRDLFGSGSFYEDPVTSVVVWGCFDVPAVTCMLTPWLAPVWFDMKLHSTAHWS